MDLNFDLSFNAINIVTGILAWGVVGNKREKSKVIGDLNEGKTGLYQGTIE